jgi:hypothetical protein
LKEGEHLKNLGVGGNDNIEIGIKYIGGEKMDCFHLVRSKKLKLKVARRGLYSIAALCIADCAFAPNDVVPSFISRGATTPRGAGALY